MWAKERSESRLAQCNVEDSVEHSSCHLIHSLRTTATANPGSSGAPFMVMTRLTEQKPTKPLGEGMSEPLLKRGETSIGWKEKFQWCFVHRAVFVGLGMAFAGVCVMVMVVVVAVGLTQGGMGTLTPGMRYVAITCNGLADVGIYSGTGAFVRTLFGNTHRLRNPRGMTMGADGALLVAQSSNTAPAVLRIANPCVPSAVGALAAGSWTAGLRHPYGLALGAVSGDLFVSNQDSSAITRYQVTSGSLVASPWVGNLQQPRGVAASKIGSSILVGVRDQNVVLELDERSATQLRSFNIPSPIGVYVTPDNRLIAGSSKDNALRMWDLQSGNLLATVQNAQMNHPAGMQLLDNSTLLVLSQDDRTVVQWDISNPAAPAFGGIWASGLPQNPEQLIVFSC